MAKSLVFFVHGMGQHADGWISTETGPATVLGREAAYYSGFDSPSRLAEAAEFIEIRYDDIFDKIRNQWANLAKDLSKNMPEATPGAIKSVTDFLKKSGEDDNWFATHALDVLLYHQFALVRRLVQLRVASTMMKAISQREEADYETVYVLIAHSLGTTVAHDAIHLMSTTAWLRNIDNVLKAMNEEGVGEPTLRNEMELALRRYGNRPFGPGNFKFDTIFQISNTSRLLARTANGNPYQSVVRPMFSGSGQVGYSCRKLFNVDHYLDPVSKFRRFRAEEAWPTAARRNTAIDLFNIYHIHDANVHSIEHYLIHPAVHSEILFSAARSQFTRESRTQAYARLESAGDFSQWDSDYQDEDLKEDIESWLSKLHSGHTAKKLSAALVDLPIIINDIRDRLP